MDERWREGVGAMPHPSPAGMVPLRWKAK